MNKEQFLRKMNSKMKKFEKLHNEIVTVVNEFLENEGNHYIVDVCYETRNIEQLAFSYAWIIDRLNKRQGFVGSSTYKKSMAKKIRKALGYSL